MRESDWPEVEVIYREGIATRRATFETTTPSWNIWNSNHLPTCRLVIREADRMIGWAALSPVSSRPVYAGVAEVSIYIQASARGQGAGKVLLGALVEESERAGVWTLQAGIFAENEASIALHAACGFRIVGYRERLGQIDGAWKDVILMERRSRIAGG
jgi:phosphinothricin acetyltransferase